MVGSYVVVMLRSPTINDGDERSGISAAGVSPNARPYTKSQPLLTTSTRSTTKNNDGGDHDDQYFYNTATALLWSIPEHVWLIVLRAMSNKDQAQFALVCRRFYHIFRASAYALPGVLDGR